MLEPKNVFAPPSVATTSGFWIVFGVPSGGAECCPVHRPEVVRDRPAGRVRLHRRAVVERHRAGADRVLGAVVAVDRRADDVTARETVYSVGTTSCGPFSKIIVLSRGVPRVPRRSGDRAGSAAAPAASAPVVFVTPMNSNGLPVVRLSFALDARWLPAASTRRPSRSVVTPFHGCAHCSTSAESPPVWDAESRSWNRRRHASRSPCSSGRSTGHRAHSWIGTPAPPRSGRS